MILAKALCYGCNRMEGRTVLLSALRLALGWGSNERANRFDRLRVRSIYDFGNPGCEKEPEVLILLKDCRDCISERLSSLPASRVTLRSQAHLLYPGGLENPSICLLDLKRAGSPEYRSLLYIPQDVFPSDPCTRLRWLAAESGFEVSHVFLGGSVRQRRDHFLKHDGDVLLPNGNDKEGEQLLKSPNSVCSRSLAGGGCLSEKGETRYFLKHLKGKTDLVICAACAKNDQERAKMEKATKKKLLEAAVEAERCEKKVKM
jgi:hypothetical protein